jgi:3-hydroxyisobutyrate dehydrogenase
MGGPMLRRLVSLGYPVRAYDFDKARLQAAADAGAKTAPSAASAVADAAFVLLNLPSAQAVEAALFGPDGVAEALTASSLVIDFSTIPASACRDLAERLRGRTGAGWIDAPVSGGPVAAGEGRLTIMAGGSDRDIARTLKLLSAVGETFTHVGPLGSGCIVKTIAQLVVGSTHVLLAEAVALAEAAGLDATILPACVRNGHADGPLMQQLYPRIAAHDFLPRSYARQVLKDLEMVQDLARATGTPTPMSSQATQLYRLLVAAGHGEIDAGGVYTLYSRTAKD